jgi:hypothetical protein
MGVIVSNPVRTICGSGWVSRDGHKRIPTWAVVR